MCSLRLWAAALGILFLNGKSLLHLQLVMVGTHHPQPMKMDFLPPELSKTGQITP
jgi:hypothetical protein